MPSIFNGKFSVHGTKGIHLTCQVGKPKKRELWDKRSVIPWKIPFITYWVDTAVNYKNISHETNLSDKMMGLLPDLKQRFGSPKVKYFKALLGKWLWWYHQEGESLWKAVIDSKHGTDCQVGAWTKWEMRMAWWWARGPGSDFGMTFSAVTWPSRLHFLPFQIAFDQEASVADLLDSSSGSLVWNLRFLKSCPWLVIGRYFCTFHPVVCLKHW